MSDCHACAFAVVVALNDRHVADAAAAADDDVVTSAFRLSCMHLVVVFAVCVLTVGDSGEWERVPARERINSNTTIGDFVETSSLISYNSVLQL